MIGLNRKLDKLGRVVVPADYRYRTGIDIGDQIKITEEAGKLIIEKLKPFCKICGSEENINEQYSVCEDCINKIKSI